MYSGNTSRAVITTTNASGLVASVIGSDSTTVTLSVAAGSDGAGLFAVGRHLGRVARAGARAARSSGAPTLAPFETVENCDSGSIRISGNIERDGTGTAEVTYDACRIGDVTVSGSAALQVHSYDESNGILSDYVIRFQRLRLRGAGISVDLSGTLRSQTQFLARTETLTLNMVLRDNLTGRMSWARDLVYVVVFEFWVFDTSPYVETITGRLYDSMDGLLEVSTLVPLEFAGPDDEFPSSGVLDLAGGSGATVRVTALSASRVAVALDVDGNGVFEVSAMLRWDNLDGPLGEDLADSDGDQMHDAWETANGLSPLHPADAPVDHDLDGVTTLLEYRAGTDPRNAASVPATVGLSMTGIEAPDPTTLGNNITYVFHPVNAGGGGTAQNVVVSVALPASFNLISASANQGACFGANPVTCNIGSLTPSLGATVSILVAPTLEGTFTVSATATTIAFDPDTSNNTSVLVTTIGQPLTGIQDMIDAAAPGSTVTVPPGTYFGNLNFNGKDIVLESAQGPGNTVLHGNNGIAVLIGPGGTLRGFTITGAAAFNGAVQVAGAGTRILANVFDANRQFAGGQGAAIGGTSASPIVEGNRFRNNTCDHQSSASVIGFAGFTSPRIVNNVFENNPCRGVAITPLIGQPLEVVNNTFVGNRIAISIRRGSPLPEHVYRNNVIFQNEIGVFVDGINGTTDADNPVWQNNLVFDNGADYQGTADQTGSNGNISVDPLFVDAADYHLLPTSPAIDAGSATGAPATDLDGTARPQGAGFDIGAFEAIP